jgi:hypothetical protein
VANTLKLSRGGAVGFIDWLDLGWSRLEDDVGINVFIRNSPLTFNALECQRRRILLFVSSSAKVNLHLGRADDQRLLSSEGTSQRNESTPSTGRRPSSRASDDW